MLKVLISTTLIFISSFMGFGSAKAEIQLFPNPPDYKPAPDYKLRVNGREVFVYNSDYNPYAIFNFEGTVNIEIQTSNDLKWVNIRPLNDSISSDFKGNSMFFTLNKPGKFSIEINGETDRALFLFTGPIQSPQLPESKIIRFDAGKIYNAGTIELHSNDILFIEGGAVVRGNIIASHADHIKILGNGILDGTLSNHIPPNRMIDLTACRDVLIQDITIHNSPTWTIVLSDCRDLEINNVKEVNWKNGSDGIDLVSSSHIRIENCFLKNNDDCIVIKSFTPDHKYPVSPADRGSDVTDITVDHCTLWNMPWGNALEIGFELRCDSISHITFKNINIIHVERGAAISIHNGDFAIVNDISYDHITIENADQKLIDLAIILSQYSMDRPETGEERKDRYMDGAWDGVLKVYPGEEKKYETNRGFINHITFSDIRVLEGPFPFSILNGYDSIHSINDIDFNNLYILNQKIINPGSGHFFLKNTDNIHFN